MPPPLAPLLALALAAEPAFDPSACAERAIAGAPEKDREGLSRWLRGGEKRPPDETLDEQERSALALTPRFRESALVKIAEEAARLGDTTRAARLAAQIDANAAARPPSEPGDAVESFTHRARAWNAAKRPDQVRKHLAGAEAALPKVSVSLQPDAHMALVFAGIALRDEDLAGRHEAAFFAAAKAKGERPANTGSEAVLVAARSLSYSGESRRALRYADEVRKLVAPEEANRQHDDVLVAILEGARRRADLPVTLEVLERMSSARTRMIHLRLWSDYDDAQRRSDPYLAVVRATLALEPEGRDVDDHARLQLVEVLSDVGLAKEALPATARIHNPFTRARAEAVVAQGLALIDREAGAKLARLALKRAQAKSSSLDEGDVGATRAAAARALARAGAVDEARRLKQEDVPYDLDVMIGLRDKPQALAQWWKSVEPLRRARILVVAAHHNPELGDPGFLAPLCAAKTW